MKVICCKKTVTLDWKEPLGSESSRVEGECEKCGKHYYLQIWDNEGVE